MLRPRSGLCPGGLPRRPDYREVSQRFRNPGDGDPRDDPLGVQRDRRRGDPAQRAQNSQPRPRPQGHAGGTDCDDQDKDVHPNAQEVCDGKDNDCDGVIDEGGVKEMVFLDADGDLHGDPTKSLELCAFEMNRYRSEGRWLSDVGNDCDDTDPERWRGCE